MDNIRIAECFTLPSRGLLYEGVDPEIALASMKTKHEMLRLSATDDSQRIMSEIIDDCLVNDIGISSYDLCLGDFQFLLYKLRIITFGPEYEQQAVCPYCGFESTYQINLDDMEVHEFDESLINLFTLTLPVSGDVITLKYQTPRMLDQLNRKVKDYKKRHKGSNENATFLYAISMCIDTINGEDPGFAIEQIVKDMELLDATAIVNRIDEINNAIGVDLDIIENCSLCGSGYHFPFRVNNTFFRPSVTTRKLQIADSRHYNQR